MPVTPHRQSDQRLLTPAYVLVTAATLGYFTALGLLITTLPRYIKGPLHGDSTGVGLAVGAFSVAAVVCRPLAGRLGDRRGRRLIMILGPAIVSAVVLLYPFAHSLTAVMGLRVLQGLGEGFFYTGAATLITEMAPPDRRGEAVSYFSVAVYLGLAVGPGMGEALISGGHFGHAWVTVAAFAAAASALSLCVREPSRRRAPTGDLGGSQVAPPAEPHPPAPLIRNAGLVPGAVLGLSLIGMAGFNTFVPLYALRVGMHGAGPVFVVYALATLAGRVVFARLPDRLGAVPVAKVGMTFVAAGLAVVALVPNAAGLFIGAVVLSMGTSVNLPAMLSLTVARSAEHERGAAVGTMTAFFDVGQGVGAVMLGPIATAFGYGVTFMVASAVSLVGVAWLMATGDGLTPQPAMVIA